MKYRKLRIAWSVAWGVVAMLLGVLWVRSFYTGNVVQWSVTRWTGLQFTSMQGQLTVRRCDLDGAGHHGGMDFPDWQCDRARLGSFSKTPTTLGFNLGHLSYFVAIPYLAPILFCVGLSAAPFLRPCQRCKFSLRTLLIAITLVAALLGMVVAVSQ